MKQKNLGKDNHGMYKFEDPNNCLADEQEEGESENLLGSKREKIYEQIPREILRDLRRPQHFRRLGDEAEEPATPTASKSIMLKDLVRTLAFF